MKDAKDGSEQITSGGGAGLDKDQGLAQRDWILLAGISLLTIFLLTVSVELTARRLYTKTPDFAQICVTLGDVASGTRANPNTVCRFKTYESQLDEYRFNRCGHRTPLDCEIKQQGAYRIVMAGSSVAMGYEVPEDKTYAWSLPIQLSQLTGRKVELYNEAMLGDSPRVLALHFNEVLAAKPDLILWTVVPFDIDTEKPDAYADLPQPDLKGGRLAKTWSIAKNIFATRPLPDAVDYIWQIERAKFTGSPIGALLLHFICTSNTQYVNANIQTGDTVGYLRTAPSDEWQRRSQLFDSDMAKVEAQARVAGVPVVVAFVPNRLQVVMTSMRDWPVGYDPYQLDNELRSIVERHGGTYIDILPSLRNVSRPEQLYFPVDGHPDANGHAIISAILAKELTGGAVHALKAIPQPQTGLEQKR
jgi:hypothetical protein